MLNPKKEARKILNRFAVNEPNFDVEDLAQKLGAQVIKQNTDLDSSGMIYIGPAGAVIGVNSAHPTTRQRFTIAHEIGHLVMHMSVLSGNVHIDKKFGVQLNRDKRSSLGSDLLEIQANQFAAELLMPSDAIKKEIKNTYFDMENDDHIQKLADKYGVSLQAMSIKLFETYNSDLTLLEGE